MNSYNGFSPAQRMKALGWLKKEYAAGRREPPIACDACGQTKGIIEAHSEDYSEPFGDHIGAYGFCFTCHMMLHCRFRAPDAWSAYCAAVNAGSTFPPFFSRNFPALQNTFLRMAFPEPVLRPAPARHVLAEIGQGRAAAA